MARSATQRIPCRGAWIATLGLVAGLLPACKGNTEAGADATRAVPVQVQIIGTGTVRQVARYVGEVRPSAKVNVLPRMAEKILALGFDEGDFVTQDETVMAQLATAVVDTGVRQARSGAEALSAQINGLKVQQERLRRLVADGVVSASQLDPIDAQIRALEAQRRQVLAGVDQANLRVEDTIVKAPMTGFVSQRFVDVGDMASPAAPLATIVRLDPVFVWVDVPEYESDLVRRQSRVTVRVETAPDRMFPAEVDLVSPTIDRQSRSVRFRYRVANPELILRDGMLTTVEVELQRHDAVVVAPAAALVLDPTQKGSTASYTAFVVRGDKAQRVTVRRGLLDGDFAEVTEGLLTGDQVVTQGFHMLEDGTTVEIVGQAEAQAPAPAASSAPVTAPPDPPAEPTDAGAGAADAAEGETGGGDAR